MPYVLANNIYGYIAQTQSFVSGDVANFTVVLYKDSLNNQLDVVNYDQVTVEVYDYLKRKKLTFAKKPANGEYGLSLGNKSNGEEGYVNFTLTQEMTSMFDAGEVYVKVSIVQSSYVTKPITTQLPFLKVADKLSSGTGSTGGAKQLPTNFKATVPSVVYSIGNLTHDNPDPGQLSFNSSTANNVTAIKMHNTAVGGKLNVYISSMVDVLNSGANLLLTITDFDSPEDYVIYRVATGGVIDANGDGGSFNDFDDYILLGVQFVAAAYSTSAGFSLVKIMT